MPIRRWPALAALILLSMTACDLFQTATPATPPPTPTGTPRPTPRIPTETPLPTETPIPSPTPIPSATPTLLATGPLPAPVELPAIETAASLLLPPDTPVPGSDLPQVGVSVVALGPDYPSTPLIYALSGDTLLRSEDNGATWELITEGVPENIVEIVVASDGELGAITAEGFAWRGLDGGRLWLAYGLPPGVEQIVFSPNYGADGTVFVVLHNELYRATQFSGRWERVFIPLAVCPVRVTLARNFVGAGPDVGGDAFLTHCAALAHSTDGGSLWQDIETETPEVWSGGFVAGISVAPYYPEDPRIVGWGGLGELAVTTDDGLTWANQRLGWPVLPALAFEEVLMSPGFSADSSLLALGRVLPFDPQLTLWRLDNGGASFAASAIVPGSACPADVALAPQFSARPTILLGSCHGLFRSNDGGASWSFVHPGVGVLDRATVAGPTRAHGLVNVLAQAVPLGEGEFLWRLFLNEGAGEGWVFADQARAAFAPRKLWPSPQFEEDGVIVALGAEVSGRLHVLSWRPGEERWRDHSDPDALEIPVGDAALLDDYTVFYDANYARSGELSLRYPGTRATFVSEDAGLTWSRVDPIEMGQCDLRPRGPLGGLWEDNAAVRFGLGCPTEPAVDSVEARYQPFENGVFLRISVPVGDERTFDWRFGLVYGDQEAEEDEPAFKNLWGWLDPPAEAADLPEPPEDGLLLPDDEFAASWLTRGCCAGYEDWLPIGERVGWALEPASAFDALFQPFEGGWLILHREWNQFIVLYLSDPDGATPWEAYSNVYEG